MVDDITWFIYQIPALPFETFSSLAFTLAVTDGWTL